MIVFEGPTAQHVYRMQLQAIVAEGEDVVCRGQPTKELLNVATVIQEPWNIPFIVPGRQWNPWLAMSEAIWILAGRDEIKPLLPYNKRIAQFSDDGLITYGAYGARLREQVPQVIARLQADPSDRRAVLSIWRERDLTMETKDPPCNDMVMFKLRGGQLHMTVINRSNDIHWGLYAVNLPTFAVLQSYVAARLGVSMGIQTHLSNSLHLYADQRWSITERMLRHLSEPLPIMAEGQPPFRAEELQSISHFEFVEQCIQVLNQAPLGPGAPNFLYFAEWYLRMYREEGDLDAHRPDDYENWCQAGRAWRDARPKRRADQVKDAQEPAAVQG